MRTTLFILAGAAALAMASPASAQVSIGAGEDGVHIGIGPDRHYRGERRHYRAYDDDYARGSCREVRSKTYRPDGKVVYRTKRICD